MSGSGSTAPSTAVPRDLRAARDALGELLARRLSEEGTGGGETVTVAELRRVLLPYPLCRESVPLASKAEYDMALLSLIHGGGYLEAVDPELAEVVEEELATAEPALGCLDDFAAASLRPVPGPRARGAAAPSADAGDTAGPEPPAPGAAAGTDAGGQGAPAAASATEDAEEGEPAVAGDADATASSAASPGPCPSCRRPLAGLEEARYCPFCGTAQVDRACAECGRRLEPGWRFCPRCGSEGRGPA